MGQQPGGTSGPGPGWLPSAAPELPFLPDDPDVPDPPEFSEAWPKKEAHDGLFRTIDLNDEELAWGKKAKCEAAAQRRPAETQAKKRRFFRKTTGRMV